MAQQLIQNVVDIMDNAHSQQQQLTESMSLLSEAKLQVTYPNRKLYNPVFIQLYGRWNKIMTTLKIKNKQNTL